MVYHDYRNQMLDTEAVREDIYRLQHLMYLLQCPFRLES